MTPEESSAVSRWQLNITEKVIGGSIIALLAWMALTTQATATKVAVIEARLQAATEDRYSASDATKDSRAFEERLAAVSARLSILEGRRETMDFTPRKDF